MRLLMLAAFLLAIPWGVNANPTCTSAILSCDGRGNGTWVFPNAPCRNNFNLGDAKAACKCVPVSQIPKELLTLLTLQSLLPPPPPPRPGVTPPPQQYCPQGTPPPGGIPVLP